MSPILMPGLRAVVSLEARRHFGVAAACRRVGWQGMPDPENAMAPRFEPDERWVPADQRLFGVDRRTIGPTLVVFALVFVMSVVLPVINAGVPYDDIVKAGDVLELQGDVTFVPEAGWGITSGVRAGHLASGDYPSTATVEHGALLFKVRTGTFHGGANQLLDQIEKTSEALNRGRGVHLTGAPSSIVTDQGKQGATVPVTGPHTTGVIAAFVLGDRGVEAVATGPSDTGSQSTAAVLRMIRSISHAGEEQR